MSFYGYFFVIDPENRGQLLGMSAERSSSTPSCWPTEQL